MSQHQRRIIPIYASNGDAEDFLVFPYLFDRSGEWIGWVTPQREVYSVMGLYVGNLSDDARIVRETRGGRKQTPPPAAPETRQDRHSAFHPTGSADE